MLSDEFCVEWQLVGQSSLTCGGILGLLQATQLKLCDVDVVLVSAGVNDVTKGTKPESWSASLIQHCIAHNDIFHLRLSLPVRSEFMAKDGFHPSASAARLWAEHAVAFIL